MSSLMSVGQLQSGYVVLLGEDAKCLDGIEMVYKDFADWKFT